jgi:hypothetical protein
MVQEISIVWIINYKLVVIKNDKLVVAPRSKIYLDWWRM